MIYNVASESSIFIAVAIAFAIVAHLTTYRLTDLRSQGTLCNILSATVAAMDKWRAEILHVFGSKESPSGFFREKMSESQNRPRPLEKLTFFKRRSFPDSTAREARFLENFGGLVVQRDAICHSVSKPQKNLSTLCQSNVTTIERLSASAFCALDRKTEKSQIF